MDGVLLIQLAPNHIVNINEIAAIHPVNRHDSAGNVIGKQARIRLIGTSAYMDIPSLTPAEVMDILQANLPLGGTR